jgi:hypothetical protein
MSVDEMNGLQAMLRAYHECMWDLDVVERAEAIVRDLRHYQLTQALEDTLAQLDNTAKAAATAHDGSDIVAMMEAEQRLCAIQHVAQTLLRRHMSESRAADDVHAEYAARRRELARRIESIEILMSRQRLAGRGEQQPL